jgi:hypothetical protein
MTALLGLEFTSPGFAPMGRRRGNGELLRWAPPPWICCNGVHNKLLSSTVGRIPPDPTGICVADVHCHQAVGHVSAVSSNLVCPPSLSQICAQVYSHRCSHRSKIIHINAGFSNSSLLSHCYQSALRLRKSVHNSSLSSIENISLLVVVSLATKKDLHTRPIQLGGATPTPHRRLSESAGDYMLLPSSSVLLASVVTHSVM